MSGTALLPRRLPLKVHAPDLLSELKMMEG